MNDAPAQTPRALSLYCLFGRWLQIVPLAALLLATGAQAAPLRILALGDSITAGLGVSAQAALPAQLARRLKADGYNVEIVNAGVSGDTTAGGLARLDYALADGKFDLAIVELGANDMMRGLEPKQARANLAQIVTVLQSKGVKVLLAAMVSSLNWGQAYKYEFDSIYPEIAEKQGATLVPFILEGVWGDPKMLVGDGVHPNEAGVAKMVGRLAPVVEKVLDSMGAQKAARPN